MNKKELVIAAAKRCGRTQTNVRECLDALLCVVSEELTKGGELTILGFGRLYCKEKKARVVKVPVGRIVKVPAKILIRFNAFSHFNYFSSKY